MQMQKATLRLIGVGASMVTVGSALGVGAYFLLKKDLEAKYAKIAEEEIAEAKRYYNRLTKKDEFSDPVKLVKESETKDENTRILEDLRYRTKAREFKTAMDAEPEDGPYETGPWQWDEEQRNRTEDEPYIIHHDEFQQNEKEYEQFTFTYFDGDDILCNEADEVVSDTNFIVGDHNLARFGHGSKDNNVVYIRNDHLQSEIEVIRRKGSYAKEVLGFIEHSEDSGRPRRFRSYDE
jgi:hypothetical protein